MIARIRSWLGPWPLRPAWLFILVATVQNFGISERGFADVFLDDPATQTRAVVGIGLARTGLALLLAFTVVAIEYLFWRVTSRGGPGSHQSRRQPAWAYATMIVLGAIAAATTLTLVQRISGGVVPWELYGGVFMHYLILLLIIHTTIGVIGSQMSTSAARAEDALAKLGEQERRFVASEEQARRIAAEFLHDRVQADLLVIAIELRRVGESAPPEIAAQIASITEVVESVRVSQVRDTSRMLSPLVQSTGLASALTTLTQRWRDAMVVSLDVQPGIGDAAEDANSDRALGVYRIIEQALLNAAAHGQARQVQVSVSRKTREDSDWIRVQISDDGVGFDPAAATDGGGFAISQVWARLLGGEWNVQSTPGQGTNVTAWLPA